jgi:hypothetical protein
MGRPPSATQSVSKKGHPELVVGNSLLQQEYAVIERPLIEFAKLS